MAKIHQVILLTEIPEDIDKIREIGIKVLGSKNIDITLLMKLYALLVIKLLSIDDNKKLDIVTYRDHRNQYYVYEYNTESGLREICEYVEDMFRSYTTILYVSERTDIDYSVDVDENTKFIDMRPTTEILEKFEIFLEGYKVCGAWLIDTFSYILDNAMSLILGFTQDVESRYCINKSVSKISYHF